MEVGGDATAHVFKKGDRGAELDTFVREVIQNSNDRRLDDQNTVRIRFDFYALEGDQREDFMEAIHWEEGLKQHLVAASKENVSGARIGRELKEIEQRPELRLLRITDSGTEGLTGGEDESGSNFKSLCKDILKRPETGKGTAGGAFGLGKAVLWTFSGLSTVLFSSELAIPEEDGRRRLFGKSSLPSHGTDDDRKWAGQGFYGRVMPSPHVQGANRAESVWDCDSDLLESLLLDRDGDLGTGTSVLIVDFDEPTGEDDRDLLEIAEELNLSVQKWWWPSLTDGSLKVEINVWIAGQRQGPDDQYVVVTQASLHPYLRARNKPLGECSPELTNVGDVVNEILTVEVPVRVANVFGTTADPGGGCGTTLRLTAATENQDLSGRVAHIRGTGMVIEYRKFPTRSDRGFSVCGVLRLGLDDEDHPEEERLRLEAFIRAAEPPEHNRLTTTERLKADYPRGYWAALDSLATDIKNKLLDVSSAPVPSGSRAPDALTTLLKVGDIGTDPVIGKLTFSGLKRSTENGDITIKGYVNNSRPGTGDDQSWEVELSLWLHWDGGGTGSNVVIDAGEVAGDPIVPIQGTIRTSVQGHQARFKLTVSESGPFRELLDKGAIDPIADLRGSATGGT
jgi:hypothetical protein